MDTLDGFSNSGERLTALLKKAGYNKKEASKKVGISRNTIRNYEKGTIPDTLTFHELSKLAKASMEFILIGEEKAKYISDEEIQLIQTFRSLNKKQQEKANCYLAGITNVVDGLDNRLNLLLVNTGYTKKEVAKELGVYENTVLTYVNGGTPELITFYQLSKLLETSMEWFLTGDVEIKCLSEEENQFIQRYRTLKLKEQGKIIGCLDGMILDGES